MNEALQWIKVLGDTPKAQIGIQLADEGPDGHIVELHFNDGSRLDLRITTEQLNAWKEMA